MPPHNVVACKLYQTQWQGSLVTNEQYNLWHTSVFSLSDLCSVGKRWLLISGQVFITKKCNVCILLYRQLGKWFPKCLYQTQRVEM